MLMTTIPFPPHPLQAGIALFPDSTFIALVYANFMLDMLGFSQTGAKQLEVGVGVWCVGRVCAGDGVAHCRVV